MVRHKYKLALCRKKTRTRTFRGTPLHSNKPNQKKTWIDSMDEVLNTVKWKAKFTPAKSMKVSPLKSKSNNKRLFSLTKSPFLRHSPVIQTPIKSPALKKVKTCLTVKFGNSPAKSVISESTSKREDNPSDKFMNDLEDLFISGEHQLLDTKSDYDTDSCNEDDICANECQSGKETLQEFKSLMPKVVEVLSKQGLHKEFLNFLELVAKDSFPMDNIAFLLWLEVVKWFQCGMSTTNMRYSKETKTFWKLGYRLFGGRFVSFMTGFKNNNQVVQNASKPGLFDPMQSEINFAVPDVKVLSAYNPYSLELGPGVRSPGVAHQLIELLSKNSTNKSYCVTFDGKKLKSGLTSESGDVDLIGFEKGKTLAEKKREHVELKVPLNEFKNELRKYQKTDSTSDMQESDIDKTREILLQYLETISRNVLEIEEKRKKREYTKDKMIQSSEGDWKNGKYVYAISASIAFIHDADCYLSKSEEVISEVVGQVCSLNNKPFDRSSSINLNANSGYHGIPDVGIDITDTNTRNIKQRSDVWYEKRKDAKVTGSTIYAAIGLDGIKKQQEHYDKVVCNVETPFTDTVKSNLEYGVVNEINACATFVNAVLPVVCPDSILCEEGFVQLHNEQSAKPFMVVSPDGSVRKNDNSESTIAAVEFKCPVFAIHKKIPERYFLQCQAEIIALNVDELYYLCWRPKLSSVFKLKRNDDIFTEAMTIAQTLYTADGVKRPTKVLKESKALGEKINRSCDTDTIFIGLFPSIQNSSSCSIAKPATEVFLVVRLLHLLDRILEVLDHFYELQREKATEVIVFLGCDLDRDWDSKSALRCAPICWLTKGYSLTTDIMSAICEQVLDSCYEAGLHVPAVSFDGQWHVLAVRNVKGEPLTVLQLQKDVWKQTEKLNKSEILKIFKDLNKRATWSRLQGGILVCTNNGANLPILSPRVKQYRLKTAKPKQAMNEGDVESEHEESAAEIITGATEIAKTMESEQRDLDTHTSPCKTDKGIANLNDDLSTVETITEGISNDDGDDRNEPDMTESNVAMHTAPDMIPANVISVDHAESLLQMIKSDKNANSKGQWEDKTPNYVQEKFQSASKLSSLRDVELKVAVRFLKKKKIVTINESATKAKKLELLCSHYNLTHVGIENAKPKRRYRCKTVDTLANMAYKVASKNLRKGDLNIIYAEYVWDQHYEKWRNGNHINRPFPKGFTLNGNIDKDRSEENIVTSEEKSTETDTSGESENQKGQSSVSELESNSILKDTYFYTGQFSEKRKQFEVACVDSSHLLTRTRRKVCKGGLENMSNGPWKSVAKSKQTNLSLAMIDAMLDPMSVPVAVSHFSEEVEGMMRKNGDNEEASLCKDLRLWWQAEDDPAISAAERVRRRMFLRNRLLRSYTPGYFPPPGMYINGWPSQLWEALVSNIDAKILLYDLCKKGTYNVRAFSSMMGETLFSELTLLDRRGQGTVTVAEVGQFIEASIEKLHIRLDPDRSFTYRTATRRPVYNLVSNLDEVVESAYDEVNAHSKEESADDKVNAHSKAESAHDEVNVDSKEESAHNEVNAHSKDEHFMNHPFDETERRRLKPKRKEETVNPKRNAVQRGSLGVRYETARRNEGKMLTTLRMGIDLE